MVLTMVRSSFTVFFQVVSVILSCKSKALKLTTVSYVMQIDLLHQLLVGILPSSGSLPVTAGQP